MLLLKHDSLLKLMSFLVLLFTLLQIHSLILAFAVCFLQVLIDNEIYLYKMLIMNLLQAMLVRKAEQSHWQSSNSAICACYAHIHRLSIALRYSQTTRSCDQTVNESSCQSDQLSQYTDWALHHDAHKQLKAHLVCSTKWSNSERKLTLKWSTFTIHWSLI